MRNIAKRVWRRRSLWRLLLVWAMLVLLPVVPVLASPTPARTGQATIPSPETLRGCGGAIFPGSDPAQENEVLRLVNEIRLNNGLLPLKQVEMLTNVARFHATDMSEESYFSHTGHDRINGELTESCQWSDRVRAYYTGSNWISENIAAGYTTPQSVVDGWMNSAGHRKDILSTENWEIGIGYFKGSGSYTRYWVQNFGRRQNVYPIVINGEASATDDGNLTIHIYGAWDEMRLRVDEREWEGWQPFASPLQWQLKAVAGQHTVEIEMRNGSESASASDSIFLSQNTAEPELNALPDSLTFFYDPEAGNVSPGFHTIQPLNTGNNPGYSWQVAADAPWLNVTPGQGSGTENVAIVPSVSGADQASNDQATVTVSLRRNDGTLIGEKKIAVSLAVIDANFALFVPIVSKQ